MSSKKIDQAKITITLDYHNIRSTSRLAKELTKITSQIDRHLRTLINPKKVLNVNYEIDIDKNKDKKNSFRVEQIKEFSLEEVFSLLDTEEEHITITIDNSTYRIKTTSERYKLFRQNRECVACGIEGKIMILETQTHDIAHFNLYGEEDEQRILMTKDHILPKSVGGEDKLENYQTMCQRCNCLKSAFDLSPQAIGELRNLQRNAQNLDTTNLRNLINQKRILMIDSLTGQ